MRLSAIVITHNEATQLETCLISVGFCDEIIVVDSFSTDNTLEVAHRFAGRVESRAWTGYADQKNFANTLSSNDWVLSIDADEEVSNELQLEIMRLFDARMTAFAYSMPRKTIHSGKWIRYGGWYPAPVVRLFERRHGTWKGGAVHEYWNADGSVGTLRGDLIHHSFRDISDQVSRNNHYSSLRSKGLAESEEHFSALKLVVRPVWKFLNTYFLKQGFRDGYLGLIICVSAAYAVFLKWAKLWELQRCEENR